MSDDVSITKKPIPVGRVLESVLCPSAGGTALFLGTVRDRSGRMRVERMILESAEDLASQDLKRIAERASKKFEVCKIAIRHRVGKMRVGDVIVAIAVSAPHRADAFAACRYIIDELKKTTPIWKKEIGGGRQRWVKPER